MRTRAKFEVREVDNTNASAVTLKMAAVTSKPFDAEGVSEDNDFARWTPSGLLEIQITNPNLLDAFKVGQKYYVDLTETVS